MMKTSTSSPRSRVLWLAGALLTTVFAGGCITHPGGKKADDRSKETLAVRRPRHHITHPGGRSSDDSKEGPAPARMMSTPPPSITHPGG